MKIFYTLFAILFLIGPVKASEVDCYDGRYKDKVFSDYVVDKNNIYGRKQKSNYGWQDLMYDVYLPKGDTATNRPAVFLAHGGGYIDFIDQTSPDIVRLAQELVLRGYVVFSVEYREEGSFTALFSEEKMVKALGRALIDIRDATCYLTDTTLNHNNPYGVDIDKVIIGGVSAGAVSFLHAVFLDSIDWVTPQYKDWILEVEPNTQALLDDKYCGANVIGLINISGAVQDTSWIKEENAHTYPAMMHVHGTADPIVPYNIDRPFGMAHLPELMGSLPIHEKLEAIGVRSELDTWSGLGHVPFLGIDFSALFGSNPIDFIFEPSVMAPTVDHMVEFCYSLIDCNEVNSTVTSINVQKVEELGFYPNPSNGQFKVTFPSEHQNNSGKIEIINSIGQLVFTEQFTNQTEGITVYDDLEKGYYSIIVTFENVNRNYTGQLVVLN